jgi:hypothetical protein
LVAASGVADAVRPLDPREFRDPSLTAEGERRARVALTALETLWFNTGTLRNLTCRSCYIGSSSHNNRLVYLRAEEVGGYLDEAADDRRLGGTRLIRFMGGEPFMNPDLPSMLGEVLARGLLALVLTDAMEPMHPAKARLLGLVERHGGDRLTLCVSIDHDAKDLHELERGRRSWVPTPDGLTWLARNGFRLAVAGRLFSGEPEAKVRAGFARLFAEHAIPVDAAGPSALVLFPETDSTVDVPGITEACWGILGKTSASVICATSRTVVKRRHRAARRPLLHALTALRRRLRDGAHAGRGGRACVPRPPALRRILCARRRLVGQCWMT